MKMPTKHFAPNNAPKNTSRSLHKFTKGNVIKSSCELNAVAVNGRRKFTKCLIEYTFFFVGVSRCCRFGFDIYSVWTIERKKKWPDPIQQTGNLFEITKLHFIEVKEKKTDRKRALSTLLFFRETNFNTL